MNDDLNDLDGLADLNRAVTSAIWGAQHCDAVGAKRGAAIAWARVSELEESLSRQHGPATTDGAVARRGAVQAAMSAGDAERAVELATIYMAAPYVPEQLACELGAMREEAQKHIEEARRMSSAVTPPETFVACGLEWQAEPAEGMTTWDKATAYAATFDLAGGGWRLPTLDELKALYKSKAVTRYGWWWSSSACDSDPYYKWFVHFGYGVVSNHDKGFYGPSARYVRDCKPVKDEAT